MLGLKSRRKPEPETFPDVQPRIVIDGIPAEPEELFELPDRPRANEEELELAELDRIRRAESERTAFPRALNAVVEDLRRKKGKGFEINLWLWTFEFHRHIPAADGHRARIELYPSRRRMRRRRWDLNIELWREDERRDNT